MTEKGLEIKKRPLMVEEAELLFEKIKETPNIIGYSIKEFLSEKNVLTLEVNNKFIGASITKDISNVWTEIAVLYILESYRDRGYGRRLFEASLEDIKGRSKDVFIVSRNKKVIGMMVKSNFVIKKFLLFPRAIIFYKIRFMFNLYRLREVLRKLIVFKKVTGFIWGYKLN